MKSLGQMIQELHEMQFTEGISNEWEDKFVDSVYLATKAGKDTTRLSEKQADKIIQLHIKHCA